MFSLSEKVLRNLMNRIKSQREEWMTSHSMVEVGDTQGVPQPTETGKSIVEFVLGVYLGPFFFFFFFFFFFLFLVCILSVHWHDCFLYARHLFKGLADFHQTCIDTVDSRYLELHGT